MLTKRGQVWALDVVIYCLVRRLEKPEQIVNTRDTDLDLLEPEGLPLGPLSPKFVTCLITS